MTRSRRGALACGLALALVAVATACGSGGSSATSEPPATTVALTTAPPTSTVPEGALDLAAGAGTFPPGLITRFQAASGCQVALQAWPAGSDPPARLRRQLGTLDLVSVRADRLRPLALAGLVVPLEPDDIDGMSGLPSRLRSLQAASLTGTRTRCPTRGSRWLLLARDDAFPDGPPTSLRVLWEPGNGPEVARARRSAHARDRGALGRRHDPFSLDTSDLAASDELLRLAPPAYRWSSRRRSSSRCSRSGQVELALGSPRVASALVGG